MGKANIALSKFAKPTPVQKYSIPIAYNKRDLMACAQTGSGKTAGFLFPCIATLLKNGPIDPETLGVERRQTQSYYRRKMYPAALILAPTRELALQIHEEA